MKMKRLLTGCCMCVFFAGVVRADLITNQADIIYVFEKDMLISGSGLGVFVNAQGGGSFNFEYGLIANEYGLYAASLGMEFTPSYADAYTPLVANNGIDPVVSLQSFLLGETKYYAYWEDAFPGGIEDEVDNEDNYGWVNLTYTGSGLVVTDSATALGGGIIVGTYNQIPEPATALLLGFGGVGAWLLRRDKRLSAEQ